jgi:hypothetical protein
MPFNQGMSLPMALGLRTTPDGPRLAWEPVEELKTLRSRTIIRSSGAIRPGDNPLAGARGELLELGATFEPGQGSVLTLNVRGVEIVHEAAKRELRVAGQAAPAPVVGGRQRLIVFADRTGLEIFAGDGLTYLPLPINLDPRETGVEARVAGGPIRLDSLEVFELRSIWPAAEVSRRGLGP